MALIRIECFPILTEKVEFFITGFSPKYFKRIELQKGIRAARHVVGMACKEKFLCES
jgi:hypothetical protein